jgi:hypothetical protein
VTLDSMECSAVPDVANYNNSIYKGGPAVQGIPGHQQMSVPVHPLLQTVS